MPYEFITPLGCLSFRLENHQLVSLSISHPRCTEKMPGDETINSNDMFVKKISEQLQAYFSKATRFKSIAFQPAGTAFEKTVWNELCKIPVGETRTYGEIAKKLNTSAQAVGNACRKNPVQLLIPCHRVISAKGIGGFSGDTSGENIRIKRWLLSHEGVNV